MRGGGGERVRIISGPEAVRMCTHLLGCHHFLELSLSAVNVQVNLVWREVKHGK